MSIPAGTDTKMAQLAINTIRTLSMDAVQAANSGHPGTPMALAPLVCALWNRVVRFDPLALQEQYGFTVDKVVAAVRDQCAPGSKVP